ncbi:MAG: hypothetical protein A2107_14985 [Verrucomicrobia bacterium GWF2_62_7]|nr:MAG: hypothetical protein A2107_14985 [Verrucomicrobia bacterium GWF2_62_7]
MIPEVRYYCQGRRQPVADFIEDLAGTNSFAAAKLVDHIRVLAAEGPLSPVLICRHLGTGFWELKTRSRVGQHRVFYCVNQGILWLLHAITKKTGKTPRKDLELAYKRMREVIGT